MLSLPTLPTTLQANLHALHERITKAARASGRDPSSVRLLAVSKAFPATVIAEAARAGQRAFGENYVQESEAKFAALGEINKTRAIAQAFDWVQSVDRLKIAERLAEQRPANLPLLNVLLQVNVSGEASKAGVAPDQLSQLAAAVAQLPRLRLRGLMTIPAPEIDVARQRSAFGRTNKLFRQLREDGLKVDVLSMGMSDDLEAAIAEGATMVRIGTAIFGARARSR